MEDLPGHFATIGLTLSIKYIAAKSDNTVRENCLSIVKIGNCSHSFSSRLAEKVGEVARSV